MKETSVLDNKCECVIKRDGAKLYSIGGSVFKYKTWENEESEVRNIKLSTDKFQGFGNFRDYGFQLSGDLKGNSDHGSYYNTAVENSIRGKAKEHFKVMAYTALSDNANCYYSVINDRQYNDIDNKYLDELLNFRVKEYNSHYHEDMTETSLSKKVVRNQVFIENVLSIDFKETSIIMDYKGVNYDLSDALYLDNLCYHHNALILAAYGFDDIQSYIIFCNDIRVKYQDEFDDNNSQFYRNLESYIVK